ncbi:ClpP-like prohead protease/major capsid protein fusion protein [Serratia plymuthica]|uniref:ClpP-like prohead protease/major capsid protein fusion protein n=1 Tax=Serratia plymuthica TaxID=82996 RepID=UPI003DA39235
MEISLYEPIDGTVAKRFRDAMQAAKGPVTVAINCGGGNVTDGLAMFNALRSYKGHTVARIDGLAASMATIVALGAKRVEMADNAYFMIHNPWGISIGEAGDMRQQADLMDQMGQSMVATYAVRSGLPESDIKAMMDSETWLTATEAKAKGFIDEIYPAEGQSFGLSNACFALLGKFTKAPKELVEQTTPVTGKVDAERLFGMASIKDQPWLTEIRGQYDGGKINLEQARQQVLNNMAAGVTPTAGTNSVIIGNGNIIGDSIKAAIMSRVGLEKAEQDNRYNGYTLRELARASLMDRGVTGVPGNPLAMVGMAFTHSNSDFGGILMDVANKAMLQGWDESPETFPQWTKKGTLPDFKTGHRAGLDGFASLREVRPGAEYKYATTSDRSEPIALATYGELFSIDRQAIINDDLGALSQIPMAMGAAARRTIGDLVYAMLQANGKMSDKNSLFSAQHNNLIEQALGLVGLGAARQKMRLQKNHAGATLNIPPKFLLVPVALEDRALQLINSTSYPEAANSGVANPYNNALSVLTEARLDGMDVNAWYLLAAQGADTIEVAYLDGVDAPYLEQQQGFTVDGATYKVRIDAGVAPLDWRGLVKSSGTKE